MANNRLTLIILCFILFTSIAGCGTLQTQSTTTPVPTRTAILISTITPEPTKIPIDPAKVLEENGFIKLSDQELQKEGWVPCISNGWGSSCGQFDYNAGMRSISVILRASKEVEFLFFTNSSTELTNDQSNILKLLLTAIWDNAMSSNILDMISFAHGFSSNPLGNTAESNVEGCDVIVKINSEYIDIIVGSPGSGKTQ